MLLFMAMMFFYVLYAFMDVDKYCNGFEEGYKSGYCYQVRGCIEPIPPICPIPLLGQEGYKDGYDRGFQLGFSDREIDSVQWSR